MCILVKKLQPIQIYSKDAGGVDGYRARTLDVEERGTEHGEGTDQTWTKKKKTEEHEGACTFKPRVAVEALNGSLLWSYQGTVHGPGVGLRAGPAACVELSY